MESLKIILYCILALSILNASLNVIFSNRSFAEGFITTWIWPIEFVIKSVKIAYKNIKAALLD
jgi:hypothetical protein